MSAIKSKVTSHHSECGTRFNEPCDCADIEPAPKVVRCGCGRKVECVTLVRRGTLHDSDDRVKSALEEAGLFDPESPPPRPGPQAGPKAWDPRPYTPPPKPGYLFWVPDAPPGYALMDVWREYVRLLNSRVRWRDLPSELIQDVAIILQILYNAHAFDGPAEETYVIIDRDSAQAGQRSFWEAMGDVFVTRDQGKAVRRVLRKMGVRDAQVGSPSA